MQEFIKITARIPQQYLDLINQIFEIERKTLLLNEENSIKRNISRLKDLIENELFTNTSGIIGLNYHNPIGEAYSETRTDCIGSISGTSSEELEIVEVIKPIIYCSFFDGNVMRVIVQKAVVVAQSKA
jgi:hypothetical protein